MKTIETTIVSSITIAAPEEGKDIVLPKGDMPSRLTPAMNKAGDKQLATNVFFGNMSAKELKEELAKTGLKGKELKEKVNEALRSERAQRVLRGVAFIYARAEVGELPDTARMGKHGSKLSLVQANAQQVDKVVADKVIAEKDEQIAAMMKRIADLEAMTTATVPQVEDKPEPELLPTTPAQRRNNR